MVMSRKLMQSSRHLINFKTDVHECFNFNHVLYAYLQRAQIIRLNNDIHLGKFL